MYLRFILILLSLFFFCKIVSSQVNPNHIWIDGYQRSDGSYVKGHYKTSPNHTNRDNFTTKPNTNPYTGEKGYITPDNQKSSKGYYYPNSNSSPKAPISKINYNISNHNDFNGLKLGQTKSEIYHLLWECSTKGDESKCIIDSYKYKLYSNFKGIPIDFAFIQFNKNKSEQFLFGATENYYSNNKKGKLLINKIYELVGNPTSYDKDTLIWEGTYSSIVAMQISYDENGIKILKTIIIILNNNSL